MSLSYKQSDALAVWFFIWQTEDGDEWTEEPNVLVLLRLEEFLSMVRGYKQVRLLRAVMLTERALLRGDTCHPFSWDGFDVGWKLWFQ